MSSGHDNGAARPAVELSLQQSRVRHLPLDAYKAERRRATDYAVGLVQGAGLKAVAALLELLDVGPAPVRGRADDLAAPCVNRGERERVAGLMERERLVDVRNRLGQGRRRSREGVGVAGP